MILAGSRRFEKTFWPLLCPCLASDSYRVKINLLGGFVSNIYYVRTHSVGKHVSFIFYKQKYDDDLIFTGIIDR